MSIFPLGEVLVYAIFVGVVVVVNCAYVLSSCMLF